MALNENNILRWTGAFNTPAFSFAMHVVVANLYANVDYVDYLPLSTSSASLGLDLTSFSITAILDGLGVETALSQACEYNNLTGNLRVYRPIDLTVTSLDIKFNISDFAGNVKSYNTSILISAVSVSWVAYSPSAACNHDVFGVNNGFLSWASLVLVNSATLTPVTPLTLKNNSPSDLDYISPISDLVTCPVPTGGLYAPLVVSNFSLNGAGSPVDFIVITQVTLACSACGSGGTPLLVNLPCNIQPGGTARFNVPAISWDTGITISYQVNPGGNMSTASPQIRWLSNSLGVKDNFPTGGVHNVDNSGSYGNFTISVNPTFGVTIFCQ